MREKFDWTFPLTSTHVNRIFNPLLSLLLCHLCSSKPFIDGSSYKSLTQNTPHTSPPSPNLTSNGSPCFLPALKGQHNHALHLFLILTKTLRSFHAPINMRKTWTSSVEMCPIAATSIHLCSFPCSCPLPFPLESRLRDSSFTWRPNRL